MLSRFSRKAICNQKFLPFLRQLRASSDDQPKYDRLNETTLAVEEKVAESLSEPCTVLDDSLVPKPLPYDGPQRDHVNFPRLTRTELPAPTRLAFIPEEWFRFLYPKLGVSGPYTLGIFTYYFLVSKEIYLIGNSHHEHFIAFWMLVYIITKSPIGLALRKLCHQETDEFCEAMRKFEEANAKFREDAIAHEKHEQWRQEGKQLLFDAKKENVGLQLEAAYRSNVMEIYKQVKRRLDYQVEVSKIDARIKQKFLVDWVIARVQESILKTPEKDTLKQCISDLNTLAARV